jgi:hypothetical protein
MKFCVRIMKVVEQAWSSWKLIPLNSHFTGHKVISTHMFHVSWSIWVNLGIDDLHVMLLSSFRFTANRFSERRALTKVVKWKLARIFYRFRFTWIHFGTRDSYKNLLSLGEFLENQPCNSCTLLTGVCDLTSAISTSVVRFGQNSIQDFRT